MHKRSFTYLLGTQTMSNAADILYIMALVSLVFMNRLDLLFGARSVAANGCTDDQRLFGTAHFGPVPASIYFIRFPVRTTGLLRCTAGPLVVSGHGARMGDCVCVGDSHVLSGRLDYTCAQRADSPPCFRGRAHAGKQSGIGQRSDGAISGVGA